MGLRERFFGKKPEEFRAPVTGYEDNKDDEGQLLQILESVKSDPKIYSEITKTLFERNPQKFSSQKEAQRYIDSATTSTDALGVAKLIEHSLGKSTFRTLSFLDSKQDTSGSVYKLVKKNIESTSFDKQAEKGLYLNVLETYGVEWDEEKISRDFLQNFFDANGQTLDGIKIETSIIDRDNSATVPELETPKSPTDINELPQLDTGIETLTKPQIVKKNKIGRVIISGEQDYDWKELIHFGGTTKSESVNSVGGFGEGLKVGAFVLLRDFGATKVKAGSRDWELDYYFDTVPSDAYREPVKGLYAKKSEHEEQKGNFLEIIFEGDGVEDKLEVFNKARELFYSSENPDFKNPSFNSKVGGFSILAPEKHPEYHYPADKYGHLYLAGQRSHYKEKDKWETVDDINLWTWIKVQPKDRDRGMITNQEMKDLVIPPIIETMSIDDAKKSVNDFKPLWDKLSWYSASNELLDKIVVKLANESVTLDFEPEYLANNIVGFSWISDLMKDKGFKLCRPYLEKVGMKTAIDKFKEMQSHSRIETTPEENGKIDILKDTALKIGLLESEIKDVWLFSGDDEKSIFTGQYNGMFYWLTREEMSKDFFSIFNTYVHEAAHADGTHGDAKFEYGLEQRKQKITQYILEHKNEWDELQKRWNELAEQK